MEKNYLKKQQIWSISKPIILYVFVFIGTYAFVTSYVKHQFVKNLSTSQSLLYESIENSSKINTFNLIVNESRFKYNMDLQKLKLWIEQKTNEDFSPSIELINSGENLYALDDFFNMDMSVINRFQYNLEELNRIYNTLDLEAKNEFQNLFWITIAKYPQNIAIEQALYNVRYEYEGHRKSFDDMYFEKLDNYYRSAAKELDKVDYIMGIEVWKSDKSLFGKDGAFYFKPDFNDVLITYN